MTTALPPKAGPYTSRRLSTITPDEIRKAAHYLKVSEGTDVVAMVLCALVDIAAGFRSGYTVTCVLSDLKLVGNRRMRYLTKRGRDVLHDLLRGVDLVKQIEPEPVEDQSPRGVLL